jgi:hypothetical protein
MVCSQYYWVDYWAKKMSRQNKQLVGKSTTKLLPRATHSLLLGDPAPI